VTDEKFQWAIHGQIIQFGLPLEMRPDKKLRPADIGVVDYR